MNTILFALLFAVVLPDPINPVAPTQPIVEEEQSDCPNVLIEDPCPWLRPDYIEPYKFDLDLGLPEPESKKYYKKLPWKPWLIPDPSSRWIV